MFFTEMNFAEQDISHFLPKSSLLGDFGLTAGDYSFCDVSFSVISFKECWTKISKNKLR